MFITEGIPLFVSVLKSMNSFSKLNFSPSKNLEIDDSLKKSISILRPLQNPTHSLNKFFLTKKAI